MMTCGYTSEQSWTQLVLSFSPSFFLLYWIYLLRLGSLRSISPLHHSSTAVLAFKSVFDIIQTCFCYEIVLFSLPRAMHSLLIALELTAMITTQMLIAKGYCLYRKSLCPTETRQLFVVSILVLVGFVVYRFDSESLYLVVLLGFGVLFCITMNFFTKSLEILNSVRESVFGLLLEGRIQAEIRLMRSFQLYLFLFYSALILRWVCLPVAYRPISPQLDIYVWFGIVLYVCELVAVLGTFQLIFPGRRLRSLDIYCSEDSEPDVAMPLYVPLRATPPPVSTPVLVLTSIASEYLLGLPDSI